MWGRTCVLTVSVPISCRRCTAAYSESTHVHPAVALSGQGFAVAHAGSNSVLLWCMQAAIGAGVEDTREVRQRLVALEGNVVKMQRAEDKRAVEIMLKVSEQEVRAAHLPVITTMIATPASQGQVCVEQV